MALNHTPTMGRHRFIRFVVLLCGIGLLASHNLRHVILPYGAPVEEPAPRDPSVPWYSMYDRSNDSLRFRRGRSYRIKADGILGPETVAINNEGKIFVLTEYSKLLELTGLPTTEEEKAMIEAGIFDWNATSVVHKDLGVGRVLGARFHGSTLYLADSALGLNRLTNYAKPHSHVELLTNKVTVLEPTGNSSYGEVLAPLRLVNSIAIGPKTGKVYFTESTDIPPDRLWKKDHYYWDTLYASKLDLARGKRNGRLCEYNPSSGLTRVLADDIHFANGVAVDPVNEEYLIVAETFGLNVLKYDLRSTHKSSRLLPPKDYLRPNVLAASLPGYVDNVDCGAYGSDSNAITCFVAIPGEVVFLHAAWKYLPSFFQKMFRMSMMVVPRTWLPKLPPKYTGVAVVDPVTGESGFIQDPSGKDMVQFTGVTLSGSRLYLGSLVNDYVGVYVLDDSGDSSEASTKLSGIDKL